MNESSWTLEQGEGRLGSVGVASFEEFLASWEVKYFTSST